MIFDTKHFDLYKSKKKPPTNLLNLYNKMGVKFSTQHFVSNVTDYIIGRKRKREDDEEISKIIDIALHTPKR